MRHTAIPSYARLSAPIPHRAGEALRVDPLGVVHYDGNSSDDDSGNDVQQDNGAKWAQQNKGASPPGGGAVGSAGDAGGGDVAPPQTHGLHMDFTPTPFMRPKVLAEGVRYAPSPVSAATAIGFFDEAKIVIFGGQENVKAVNDTWIYDIPERKYIFVDPLGVASPQMQAVRTARGFTVEKVPAPRCGHCAVAIGDVKEATRLKKAHYAGKDANSDNEEALASPHVVPFDETQPISASPVSGAVSSPPPPTQGTPNLKRQPSTGGLLASSSSFLHGVSAIVPPTSYDYQPSMLMFGGADISRGAYFNDLWVFDLEALAWREVKPRGTPPTPRWQHTGCILEMRLFVYGGEGSNFQVLDDLHLYDHMTGLWRNLRVTDPVPPGRMLHTATAVQHKMIIVGGVASKSTNGSILRSADTSKRHELADVWQLDMRTLVWRQLATESKLESPFLLRSDMGVTQEAGKVRHATLPHVDPAAEQIYKSLEGHCAMAFDHRIVIYGGKLNGKFNRRIFALDLATELWRYLGDCPAGQGDGKTTQARSLPACCCLLERSTVNPLHNAISLAELAAANVPLHDSAVMEPFLHASAKKIAAQLAFTGVLSVYNCRPLLTRTACAYIYGGSGNPRNFSDMWRVELHNDWQRGDTYEALFGSRAEHLLKKRRNISRTAAAGGAALEDDVSSAESSSSSSSESDGGNGGAGDPCHRRVTSSSMNGKAKGSAIGGAKPKHAGGKKAVVDQYVFGAALLNERRGSGTASPPVLAPSTNGKGNK